MPAAKDFVTDAHAHKKFIGYVAGAAAVRRTGSGRNAWSMRYVDLSARGAAKRFVEACRAVRLWEWPERPPACRNVMSTKGRERQDMS